MVRLPPFFALAVLLLMSGMARAEVATTNLYEAALPAWAEVLQQHVDPLGRIDFAALAAAPESLAAVVAAIAAVSPESHPQWFPTRDHVLAYHINAYNALAMQGVLDRGIPEGFTSFFKRASFFRLRGIVIGGKQTNLYTYENQVIRPLAEPRTHFALNCMVKDCPRLPQEPFLPATLEQQLEAATRAFFSSSKYLRLDADQEQVHVSSILKFYTKDFVPSGRARDLPSYINRYAPEPISPGYRVRFIKYDWRINAQPR